MYSIELSKPAVISALGSGVERHFSALFTDNCDMLSKSIHTYDNNPRYFGEIKASLRDYPSHLSDDFHSRSNQILWTAALQIEDDILSLIKKYGRERILVIVGSSTSGADENLEVFKNYLATNSWQNISFKHKQTRFCAPAEFLAKSYGLCFYYGISTACTSGLKAMISAARLLKLGVFDAVICAATDSLSYISCNGFNSLELLSDKVCHPFADDRTGINIGEAAVVFIITRSEENTSANKINLLSYGESSDAYHISSPRPDGRFAIKAFEDAIKSAKISAQDIELVHLHATGTIANDAMEAKVLHQIFSEIPNCLFSKNLTGHTLGVAGLLNAAFCWALMSSEINPDGKLPKISPDYPFADDCLLDIHEKDYFCSAKRICAATAYAFGGSNAVVLLGKSDD